MNDIIRIILSGFSTTDWMWIAGVGIAALTILLATSEE